MEAETIKHDEMVRVLAKPGAEILKSLDAKKCDLIHSCFGLITEVGEMCDAVKRHVFYEQPLDRENCIEESGDIEFYHELLRQTLDFVRATAIQMNISKLGKRYEGFKYTDQRAKERADKQ